MKDKKFEGSPTELLMGAEAAPDHPSGETCMWCEHDTAEVIDEAYGDPAYDREGYTNWARYQCSTCGCIFDMGTKTIEFSKIIDNGKPELSVDALCVNCKHIDKYSNNEYPCVLCSMNETQIHGHDHFEYGNHFEKKPEQGCHNCKWSEENPIIGMDGIGCAGCDTEPNGQLTHSDPTAKNNWTAIEREWGE